mmetsp:Transcript_3751/g.7880  ORF Transcript_3751/g.7880 Transcript_3751/m.7880 type:complete len:791 (+) Transcript_3751:119-2491(+)
MISKSNKRRTKAARVFDIASIAALSPCHCSSMSSLHRATIASVLLAAIAASPASIAFSPAPASQQFGFGGAVFNSNSNRIGVGRAHDVNSRHHSSFCLLASMDAAGSDNSNEIHLGINGNNEININDIEEEGEEDEVDIITQKLRRNAESGPINPMKEHDKMRKENEYEAKEATKVKMNGNNSGNNNSSDTSVLYSHMLASAIDPDFDPDASTDEAYVESQFKELLSRKGKELLKLGPGIATLPLDPSSDEAKSEEELAEKELALQQIIDEAKSASFEKWDEANLEKSQEKQNEILERAAKLQAEIDALHVDDCGAVLLANLAFYEAFSLQDAEGMRDAWWGSPSVACLHPSREALVGSNAVFGSFEALFENGMRGAGARNRGGDSGGSAAGVYMTPTNIRGLSVRGTTASLVCDEEVYAKGSAGTSVGRMGGQLLNKLLTTNIFRKIGGKWKMVHRHASWHPDTTAAQEAMKAEPGIVLYDEKKEKKNAKGSPGGVKINSGMTLKRLRGDGGGTSKRPTSSSSVPESLEDLDANSILGVPVPKEEEPKNSPEKSDAEGMIGKILNLSDLLGGGSDNSGDKDDEEEKGLGDALADMLMGSTDSDSGQVSGSGTPEDPFVTRRIIRIGPGGIENVTPGNKKIKKSNKASGDEDDEEVVIDLRDKSEEERKEVLSRLGLPLDVIKDAELDDASTSYTPTTQAVNKDELRQKCIATLRKLSDKGLLSSKQKRILLTDIIMSSGRGETSMVEVAYELLCTREGDEAELDTGMEDFTEQCRVFAAMGEEEGKPWV